MNEYPHYNDGTVMKEEDEFYLNGEFCIVDKIEKQDDGYDVYYRTNKDIFVSSFDFWKEHDMYLFKKKDKEVEDEEEDSKEYEITFYFKNKEAYSTITNKKSLDRLKNLMGELFNSDGFLLFPDCGINMYQITHFEIEELTEKCYQLLIL